MAYTKTLVGNITKGTIKKRGDKRLQALADTIDENLTNIETAFGLDTVLGFGVTEPPAVGTSTSGTVGDAATAARSNHSHDLSAHDHTDETDGGALTAYQAAFTANTTLTDLGIVPPTETPWAGTAMGALTGASTFQALLDAIATDVATAATLPAA